MKVLITADEVKKRALMGERKIFTGPDVIITPAARDFARDMGMEIIPGTPPPDGAVIPEKIAENCRKEADVSITPELVAGIVQKVLAALGAGNAAPGPVVEEHPGGLRLVRGDTVVCDHFDTGSPGGKVYLKDVLPPTASPNMCAGFMTMEQSSFKWELKYDEYSYIIDGELDITLEGRTYTGKAGDVFFIPRGTTVTFGSRSSARMFYVTYPANWRDQQ